MADTHDYLENQIREIEADLKRASKRVDQLVDQINPVSEFGNNLRLEFFSYSQSLDEMLRRLGEARGRVRENRVK